MERFGENGLFFKPGTLFNTFNIFVKKPNQINLGIARHQDKIGDPPVFGVPPTAGF